MELTRGEFFAVADKHPNTKIGKLCKYLETEKKQKNIVLLLVELAQHPEIASNTSFSLKYFLDMFEELPDEASFSEAGLLLLNSAKIYGKQVDSVYMTVEGLILSLSNSENITNKGLNTNTSSTATIVRRGQKRPIDQQIGSYESDIHVKRFKKLSSSKRFEISSSKNNSNFDVDSSINENNFGQAFVHPTVWNYSTIKDYDDELDSKKYYKVFTYHLEHRYNSLIPDINFKMYFKMKDFIDAEYKDCTDPEIWPPLSKAYIEHYVHMENQILHKEGHSTKQSLNRVETNGLTDERYQANSELHNQQIDSPNKESLNSHNLSEQIPLPSVEAVNMVLNKNLIETPMTKETHINSDSLNDSAIESQSEQNTNRCLNTTQHDSTLLSSECVEQNTNRCLNTTQHDSTLLSSECVEEDLTTIKVKLPHLDDEGVFFTELDEIDQRLLSPSVVATDVFRCVKDKSNIVVIVDDVIKKLHNIVEPIQVLSLPVYSYTDNPPVSLNILKINQKYFKKRQTFKLGSEFHLLKKERHKKYRCESKKKHIQYFVMMSEEVTNVTIFPVSSPNYEPDLEGFPEEITVDKNRTLSRDSGICIHSVGNKSDTPLHQSTDEPNVFAISIQSNCALREPETETGFLTSTKESLNGFAHQNIQILHSVDDEQIPNIVEKHNNNYNQLTHCLLSSLKDLNPIQKWHAHLQPFLAKSKDRHHYDIFELGTTILDQFQRLNSEMISLSHVMKDKENSTISRYFLSTLLLANQGNIGIDITNRNLEMPSALSDINLILLTEKRNIVSFNDRNSTPQTTTEQIRQQSVSTNIRTLKSVPSVPKNDENDSGISSDISFV